ncbi:MAG: putative ABC transporter permease [Spirochaetales bacterium]|nr:putative ABC transporter permease [Spirochaetales bacterium]MDY5914065.1 putative ABC transporter permease [Treponema sp.]
MNLLAIYELPFWSAFLIFILFSFIGWISEVIYVGVTSAHKFVNRGFLHGPLCPVYGFGGVMILMLPPSLYKTWIPLFFASMILCTIVEYFVSWLMEKLFHTRWWDYSHYKIQLNGRICLLNSILFGFLGVVVIHFVYPLMIDLLNSLGQKVINVSGVIILAVLSVDIFFTVRKLVDFANVMKKLKELGETLNSHYGQEEWFKKGSFIDMINSVIERADNRKEEFNQKILEKIDKVQNLHLPSVELFIKKFPSIKSTKYKDELNMIKEKIHQKIEAAKKKDKQKN